MNKYPRKVRGVSLVNTQGLGNVFQVEDIIRELAKPGWSSWRCIGVGKSNWR